MPGNKLLFHLTNIVFKFFNFLSPLDIEAIEFLKMSLFNFTFLFFMSSPNFNNVSLINLFL